MESGKLPKWLSSIKKYSLIDEKLNTLVNKLRSLATRLKLEPCHQDETRALIIVSLKHLLHHKSAAVVKEAVNVLINTLTDDSSSVHSELVLALMKQSANVFSQCGKNLSEHVVAITELLVHLVLDNEENQHLLRSSCCLHHILRVFSNMQFEDCSSLDHLSVIVNLLIAAIGFEPRNILNRTAISQVVIPKVVNYLSIWNSSPDRTAVFDRALKDLLFLCGNLVSNSEACQNIFLDCGGLEMLVRTLKQTELMQEHMFIQIHAKKDLDLDLSPTLFSSTVCLMDSSVTHNEKACIQAVQLGTINILQQYLSISPANQQMFIVQCLVHLLEAEIVDPTMELLHEMSNIVSILGSSNNMDVTPFVSIYIKEKMKQILLMSKKTIFRKGTPHPRKMKKTLKRLLPSPLKFKDKSLQLLSTADRNFQTPFISVLEENPGSQLNLAALLPKEEPSTISSPPQPSIHFVSTAELIFLMNCVQVCGVNMHNVRRVFPFHKGLTPRDLYALWRAIWKS